MDDIQIGSKVVFVPGRNEDYVVGRYGVVVYLNTLKDEVVVGRINGLDTRYKYLCRVSDIRLVSIYHEEGDPYVYCSD